MCDLMIQLTMPGTHRRAQREVGKGGSFQFLMLLCTFEAAAVLPCAFFWHSPATCSLKRLTYFCQSQAHVVLAADHFVCFKNSFCSAPQLKRQEGLAGKGLSVWVAFLLWEPSRTLPWQPAKQIKSKTLEHTAALGHTSSTPLAQDSMGTDKRHRHTPSYLLFPYWGIGFLH